MSMLYLPTTTKSCLFEVDQIDVALDMIQERVELAAVTLGSEGPF